MGPPRKVDANDDASEDVLQYLENFCFFIYLFFYRHDVGSKLQGHTFDPVKLTVKKREGTGPSKLLQRFLGLLLGAGRNN